MTDQPHPIVNSRVAAMRFLVAGAIGGLLWAPYGVFEILEPWGADTLYRDELAYEVVIDPLLYRVYSVPGSLALLLTACGLLGVIGALGQPVGRTTRALVSAAVALAILSVAGVIIPFDPLFTAPRIAGTLALGAGMLLAGIEASRTGVAAEWSAALMALGLLGLFLLPLWPLVHAIALVPEAAGAGVIALFGFGWVLLGSRVWYWSPAANYPDAGAVRQVRALAR